MNGLRGSTLAKITAVFLLTLTVLSTVVFSVGSALMAYIGVYNRPLDSVYSDISDRITQLHCSDAMEAYLGDYEIDDYFENTNFLYTIRYPNGQIITSTYNGEEYKSTFTMPYTDYEYYYSPSSGDATAVKEVSYEIQGYVKSDLSKQDSYAVAQNLLNFGYKWKYAAIAIALTSLLISAVLFIFLMCSAGHKKGVDEIVLNSFDKVPFDFLTLVYVLLIFIALSGIASINISANTLFWIILSAVAVIAATVLLCVYFMSLAARVKAGKLIKGTIIYMLCAFVWRLSKKLIRLMRDFFLNIPLAWKTFIVMLSITFIEFIVIIITCNSAGTLLFLWFLSRIILIPCAVFIAISLRRLQNGGQKIAQGDLDYHIDTSHMLFDFKKQADNLNSIRVGMSKAVDERMKSERFKTELITNVSHDIKTPLTSIINYVDLIEKEELPTDTLKEYVSVLDRQSNRLKKLIEDLVEASKAATGNMPVNLAKCEVGVLLAQTAGEYAEKLKDNELELILNQPQEDIYIMADGRHMWRIFDNLMNNICKYAQPLTRVYLKLTRVENRAVVTFMNVSKYPLNISSEELMERFVRGDSSRNTEGSGLGLSIAKSLTELQNGRLHLFIDGDLFKVILVFDMAEDETDIPAQIQDETGV